MRHFLILASLASLALASCTGIKARDEVLMPIAEHLYSNVRPEIDRGIADAVEDGVLNSTGEAAATSLADRLGSILSSDDRELLVGFPWETLELFAARGVQDMIDDGEISVGVATILLERIINLRDVLAELANRISLLRVEHPLVANNNR